MERFSTDIAERTVTRYGEFACEICDHVNETEVEVGDEFPQDERNNADEQIRYSQNRKRQKLNTHCLQKRVCPNYGFEEDSDDEK